MKARVKVEAGADWIAIGLLFKKVTPKRRKANDQFAGYTDRKEYIDGLLR